MDGIVDGWTTRFCRWRERASGCWKGSGYFENSCWEGREGSVTQQRASRALGPWGSKCVRGSRFGLWEDGDLKRNGGIGRVGWLFMDSSDVEVYGSVIYGRYDGI
jgi:hypothetical protein